ncbi:hypothetical protein IFU09_14440 [Pseudomonas viridiflava]|nr:hypothetical protein [Pseudomonas viridiflava]MBD8202488.1 hypothetical protein [Pseudomonas viridiflava]
MDVTETRMNFSFYSGAYSAKDGWQNAAVRAAALQLLQELMLQETKAEKAQRAIALERRSGALRSDTACRADSGREWGASILDFMRSANSLASCQLRQVTG